MLKDQAHDWRADQTASQRPSGKLPSILLLPRSCVHPHHQPYDISTACDVEDLEHSVPPTPPWRHPEEIKIASAEDQDVQELCEERYAFRRLVAMDGPDEDAFGGRMGHITQNAEDIHVDGRRPSFDWL